MATEDEKLHESITIDILEKCESSRLNRHSKQSNETICMVPDTLRNLNPDAYTPRIISIGPLHKEDQHLRAMEEYKEACMNGLFRRAVESRNKDMKKKTVESTKEDMKRKTHTCVKAVLGLLKRVRASYAPSFTNYDDSKLATMMVTDGCFILELLIIRWVECTNDSANAVVIRLYHLFGYIEEEDDPIFNNNVVIRDVKYDLLLLENQIPFFILETLFNITVKSFLKDISLTDLIFNFFVDMNILNNSVLTLEYGRVENCHILGLLHSCYRPNDMVWGESLASRYSATEIAGAGVTFKPQRKRDSQLAVKFKQSSLVPGFGKLFIREASFKIPVLRIEDSTPSFLWNLIAYEQCYPFSRPYVTSFAFLMDMLIDTKFDVSLLVRAKVLRHNLGACEDIANLFNSICNGVVRHDFYYSDEWAKLDAYCNRFWPSILISIIRISFCISFSLRRLYRGTTWKTLTVIGAVAIFVLTLIQTIYAVRNA